MSLFHNILKEFSGRLQKKESYKEDIARIISQEIGVIIKPDQIKIKDGKLFANISPTIKTQILLKKEKILEKLKNFNILSIN